MNVRYQSIPAFVTGFGPFCNRSCKFCSLTIEYQVFQSVPSVSILQQFERILVTNSPTDFIFPLWNDGHQCMELILCRVVESSCLPTHNIVPHISWHDLPGNKTTKKYANSQSMEVFQFTPRKFVIQTWPCICQQYLCLFHVVFECSPSYHDQGKMWFSQIDFFMSTFHVGSMFVSFQPILCHPHTQIRTILFHDEQRDIPNLEFSPIHVSRGFSQIAFPIIVLPKDDHTDFVQEERLGLPYWTMILAICVVVDESKCLDTPIVEFTIICEHFPFLLGNKLILRLLLVHRNQAIWKWYPWS